MERIDWEDVLKEEDEEEANDVVRPLEHYDDASRAPTRFSPAFAAPFVGGWLCGELDHAHRRSTQLF